MPSGTRQAKTHSPENGGLKALQLSAKLKPLPLKENNMSLRPVQAIVTKYLPSTNTRPSRIKATAAAGSLTIHIDHALNIEDNHAKAADLLARKFGWRGNWFMGGLPDDAGYCFVCTDNFEALAFSTLGRVA